MRTIFLLSSMSFSRRSRSSFFSFASASFCAFFASRTALSASYFLMISTSRPSSLQTQSEAPLSAIIVK